MLKESFMSKLHRFLSCILTLGLVLVAAAPALTSQINQIRPVVSIAPSTFPAGQAANALICISNSNPASDKSMKPGDTFKLAFDTAGGTVSSFTTPLVVNSSTLSTADFGVGFGTSHNQVIITYNGPAKRFAAGDSFCLQVLFMAGSTAGSGTIAAQAPAAENGGARYESIGWPAGTVSILNSAGQPGTPPEARCLAQDRGEQPPALTQEDNGRAVLLKTGAMMSVELKGFGGTGYLWQVAANDPTKLELNSTSTEVADKRQTGGPRYFIFCFKALSPGDVRLQINYLRPWEKNKPPAEKFGIDVQIRE
jgi:inhibitor of cysteine peptidase